MPSARQARVTRAPATRARARGGARRPSRAPQAVADAAHETTGTARRGKAARLGGAVEPHPLPDPHTGGPSRFPLVTCDEAWSTLARFRPLASERVAVAGGGRPRPRARPPRRDRSAALRALVHGRLCDPRPRHRERFGRAAGAPPRHGSGRDGTRRRGSRRRRRGAPHSDRRHAAARRRRGRDGRAHERDRRRRPRGPACGATGGARHAARRGRAARSAALPARPAISCAGRRRALRRRRHARSRCTADRGSR